MPTAAPQLTGEVLLGQLTERMFALYDEALKCAQERIELRSMQRLIIAMGHKVGREFSELVQLLNRKDMFLNFWAGYEYKSPSDPEPQMEFGFEDDLNNMLRLVGDRTTLGSSEVVDRVKSLLLSFTQRVKKQYGAQRAAIISAKLKEFESRRLASKVR